MFARREPDHTHAVQFFSYIEPKGYSIPAVDLDLARPYRDFEDALQYHCAGRNDIATAVTRNERDYPDGIVQIVAPLDLMKLDAADQAT